MSNDKKKNEELEQTIVKRIGEITQEIESLINKKEAYKKAIASADTRITQLVGAIEELSKLTPKKETEENEIKV